MKNGVFDVYLHLPGMGGGEILIVAVKLGPDWLPAEPLPDAQKFKWAERTIAADHDEACKRLRGMYTAAKALVKGHFDSQQQR